MMCLSLCGSDGRKSKEVTIYLLRVTVELAKICKLGGDNAELTKVPYGTYP